MKRIAIVCFSLLLTACSSQFAYNNLDWLAYWYIDDYVDLDRQQKDTFDIHLEKWLVWHRKEELQKYKEHLTSLRARFAEGGLTQEEILQEFDKGRSHWERLRAKVSPELSQFATLLSERQVEDLFSQLEEQNTEWEEDLKEQDPEKKVEERIEDLEDRVKEYIGKLTSSQQDIIESFAPRFRSNSAEWLKYRRLVQSEAKAMFENRANNQNFSAELLVLMTQPETYRHTELTENSDHNRALYAQLLADISATLNAKQKKRVFRKIDNLIDDLQDLIDDA